MERYQEIRDVYHLLEDEVSKQVFWNRLQYAVSDDIRYLLDMIESSHNSYNGCNSYNVLTNIRLLRLCRQLHTKKEKCRVVIFGASPIAMTVIQLLYEYGILESDWAECFFVDNDINKQNTVFPHHNPVMRLPIYSPDILGGEQHNTFILTSASRWGVDREMIAQLKNYGFSDDVIFPSNIPPYEYDLGNIYFEKQLMKSVKGDVFVDAGAYDMRNTEDFIRWCPEYDKVYAFEADPVSYAVCKERVKLPKVEIFNYGVWSEESEISFMSAPSGEYGGSRIDQNGSTKVKTIALDKFLSGKKVSIIKMDIEGAELEALKGAKDIIATQKPCLTLSVYHKKEDIIELPQYIHSLNPDYKFFMRHHTYGIWDTVLYAIDRSRYSFV